VGANLFPSPALFAAFVVASVLLALTPVSVAIAWLSRPWLRPR